jgi:Protein of unknown function (DUF2530)
MGTATTLLLGDGRGGTASLMVMARRRRRGNEPPAVRPVDVDGVRTVAIGTVMWAVAFVVLAVFRDELDDQGMGWWLWTCLAGIGLGLLGLEYTRKRRDAIVRAQLGAEADRPDDVELVGPEDADVGLSLGAKPPTGSAAEPEPLQAEPEPAPAEREAVWAEPEPAPAEREAVWAEPEPAPAEREAVWAEQEPAQAEPEPIRTEPEPIRAEPQPPSAQWTESALLDVGPPVPAPPPSGRRRERRATTDGEHADQVDDEPLLPTAWVRPPAGGRRARRSDSADETEHVEDDALYRGRRARRP